MQLSQIFLVLAFFVVALSSASAKSIQKREAELDSYDELLKSIDNIRNIPFAGSVIAPYAAVAKGVLENLDHAVDGNIANIINSIMPCKFSGLATRCEGTLDVESARKIAKKLLGLIPLDTLPESVSSVVRLATELI